MIDWIFISTLTCNLRTSVLLFIVAEASGEPVAQLQINQKRLGMNKNNLTQGNDQSTELEVFLETVVANLLKRFVNRQASFILLLLTFAFLRNISQNTVIKIGFKNVSSNIKTQSSLEFNGQQKLLSRTFKGKTSLTTFDCAASTF